METNCLINRQQVLRIPDVQEREMMMGFPLNYTANCVSKADKKKSDYNDVRLTLIGNSWSVPVVSCLLQQLFSRLGFIGSWTPQDVLNEVVPQEAVTVQGRLFRLPLNQSRPGAQDRSYELAPKLSNLVSIKGEDVLLTTQMSQQVKYHPLRATVPSRCWRWKVVTGWQWKSQEEHINSLELRAVLTSLRWRLEHQEHLHTRFLHLTDSLVCLHVLLRGRSSSRKLRRTMARINALTLASGIHPFWGYVHTDQNPADKPL